MAERVLGDVATKKLFENERVRVWEMRLAPGESSAVHRHDLDYLLVQIDGERIAGIPEPDTGGRFTETIEGDVSPGLAVFIERGGIETAKNTGSTPYHEILIELKDESERAARRAEAGPSGLAPKAPRADT